jgi:dihydrofolate reductase
MTTGKVIVSVSMSLDGFVAGPNASSENGMGDEGMRLFAWFGQGDTEYRMPSGQFALKVSRASAEMMQSEMKKVGALVAGRKTFEITHGWGGRHPIDVPVVVVTHSLPQDWVKANPEAPFTFVTDGVESAIRQAKAIAGEKNVAIATADIAQQCLKAGLLDEIQVDLVPVLLGQGVRLFDHLGAKPVELEAAHVVQGQGVTHLAFRVVK